MAIRKRTTKSVAKRHDLDYFKKGSKIRLWQWYLAAVALIAAVVWVSASSLHSANAFSAGPISNVHAVFGQKCEVCHIPVVKGAGWVPVVGNRRHVPDSACLSCHVNTGPHHAGQATTTTACSGCHLEHIGSMHLASSPNKSCTVCHANLEVKTGLPNVAAHVDSFVKGHPDFRPLRLASAEVKEAAFGLKFNHAEHMAKGLAGPVGQGKVNLQCASCHQVQEANGRDAAHSGLMAQVDFERSCRSCHTLDFDKLVKEQAPHSTSAEALAFVRGKEAMVHPGDQLALGKAEAILFREKCALCHTVEGSATLPKVMPADFVAPKIGASKQPERFYAAAIFSHTAHSAVQCEECHGAALTSQSGKDLLMPSIVTCQKCHDGQSHPQGPVLQSGHAESGCSLCHGYHEEKPRAVAVAQGSEPATTAFRVDQLVSGH